jgi:hypothetical protein
MVEQKKNDRDAIGALLDLSIDVQQDADDAAEELRAMGVDVDGFLMRVRERRARELDEERTAWLRVARAGLGTESARASSKYAEMNHAQLVAEFRRRPQQQASSFFHKLEEIKDEDLRTLLVDLDDLEDGEEGAP